MARPVYLWPPGASEPIIVLEPDRPVSALQVMHRLQPHSVYEAVVDQGWWIDWPPNVRPYPDTTDLIRPIDLPPDPYQEERHGSSPPR